MNPDLVITIVLGGSVVLAVLLALLALAWLREPGPPSRPPGGGARG